MRWCAPVLDAIAAGGAGGYVVIFPTYRPDLVEELAIALGYDYIDFRKERMAPLGMQAHALDLAAIEDCAGEHSRAPGVVLHNVEALLATRPADVRRAYIAAFVATPRNTKAILPLALFGTDASDHAQVIRLDMQALPEETMLRQLASMRFQ